MRSAKAMLAGLAAASAVLAASAVPVLADTSRAHATGPNASASAAAGSSTGSSTSGPCRVIKRGHAGASNGGLSTSINTGAGGLSGTTTIGPNGPSVTINPGNGTASVGTATAGGASAHAEANSGCVVTVPRDEDTK